MFDNYPPVDPAVPDPRISLFDILGGNDLPGCESEDGQTHILLTFDRPIEDRDVAGDASVFFVDSLDDRLFSEKE